MIDKKERLKIKIENIEKERRKMIDKKERLKSKPENIEKEITIRTTRERQKK
jgi:hypothetical protein